MSKLKVTANDLISALKQYGKALSKRPPGEGWQTLEELATASGQSRAAVRYQVRMAQRQGVKMETATGSVEDVDGRIVRSTFYRLRS